MASLSDTLIAQNAEPVAPPNLAEGLKTGMQLAQMQQQNEQNKMKLEQQKAELDVMKFNKATGMLNTLARSRPEIAKRMVPKIKEQMMAAGIPIDDNILDVMASDDAWKKRFLSAGDLLSGMAKSPEAMREGLAALQDMGELDKGFASIENQMKLKQQLEAAQIRADAMAQKTTATLGQRAENQANIEHRDTLNKIKTNPLLKQKLTQIQNLDNASATLMEGTVTPQNFHEYQQAIRSNLGIKGTGGVDERMQTYYNTLGIKLDWLNQFLTAKPTDIESLGGKKFLDHVTDMAKRERANVQAQSEKMLNVLASGKGSFYRKHPELKQDLQDFISGQESLYEAAPAEGETAPTAAPPPAAKKTAAPPQDKEAMKQQLRDFLKQQKPNATPQEIEAVVSKKFGG